MSANRTPTPVHSSPSDSSERRTPLVGLLEPPAPVKLHRINDTGALQKVTTRKQVMPGRRITIRVPSSFERSSTPTEEDEDPDLLSDAESEFRPENAHQERIPSPTHSGNSRESRVGPIRGLVFPPPTIRMGTNLEVPPKLRGTKEGARRLTQLVATCSWGNSP